MTLEQSIEEAKSLKEFIRQVSCITYLIPTFKEGEVDLRAKTLKGFIAILQNDVLEMIQEWQEATKS